MKVIEVLKEFGVAVCCLIVLPFVLLIVLLAYITHPLVVLFDKGDAEDEDEAVL